MLAHNHCVRLHVSDRNGVTPPRWFPLRTGGAPSSCRAHVTALARLPSRPLHANFQMEETDRVRERTLYAIAHSRTHDWCPFQFFLLTLRHTAGVGRRLARHAGALVHRVTGVP